MRKKCIKSLFFVRFCLLLVLSVLCSCILAPSTASAYDFGSVYSTKWKTGTNKNTSTSASSIYLWNGGQGTGAFYTYYAVSNNGDALWILNNNDVGSAGNVQSLTLKPSVYDIPAHSLFSFSVRYGALAGTTLRYSGATPVTNSSNSWYLLNDSCFANADVYSQNAGQNYASDMVCTYYGYTDHAISNLVLGLYLNYEADGLLVMSKGVSWVEVSDSSGSGSSQIATDLQTIIGKIDTTITQNTYINYNIEDIEEILSDMQITSESSAEAIQELVQQNQDDRQELEDTAQEAQDTADEQGAEAEETGQTLIGAFSAFVTALTNVQPSNCVINANLGHMNLGNINLCSLDPPPAFQTIASIVLIAFVVPLSIALVKKMISLFRSFQNG